MKKLLPIAAIALLAFTGCSSSDAGTDAAPAAEETTTEEPATPEPTAEAPEPETATMGIPVTAGDWEVTINSWNPNVNAESEAAAPDVYQAPPEGKQYALMNVTMKYNGTGTGDNANVQILYVPDGPGVAAGLWEAFGTTPGDNKLVFAELTPGGEINGDALYLIDANTTGFFEVYAGNEEPVVVTP